MKVKRLIPEMTPDTTRYRFKVRTSENRKFIQTTASMTIEEAKRKYGAGNYIAMEHTKETIGF